MEMPSYRSKYVLQEGSKSMHHQVTPQRGRVRLDTVQKDGISIGRHRTQRSYSIHSCQRMIRLRSYQEQSERDVVPEMKNLRIKKYRYLYAANVNL